MAAELGNAPSKKRSVSAGPTMQSPQSLADSGPTSQFSPGGSPARVGARRVAASPSAPTRDMTLAELTHAYQHLASQASMDQDWAGNVEGAITTHAQWLENHTKGLDKHEAVLVATDLKFVNIEATLGAHEAKLADIIKSVDA